MIRRLLGGWRHPVRLVAMSLAALSLAWGVALTEGLVAAMVGAALGVVAGEVAGRSRLRLGVALGGLAALLLVAVKGGELALTTEALPDYLGPGVALAAVGVVRFGALAFALVAGLRAVAVRKPAALAFELGIIAAAVTSVFASHRDGVIARPLWLSDWAWQQGVDPGQVFLVIGAVAVTLLAVLLVAETKSGRALSSLLALAALAVFAVSVVNVVGAPDPRPESVLGLTDAGMGGPPRQHHVDGGRPGPSPNQGGDGGQSQQPGGRDGGMDGGADGGDAGDAAVPITDAGDGGDGSGANDVLDGGDGAGAGDASDAGDGGLGLADGADGDGGGAGADVTDGGDGGGAGASQDASDDVPMPQYPTDGSIDPNTPPPQNIPPPSEQFDNENSTPSQSRAPMALVQFDQEYTPPSGAYYFRQDAWSQYNGVRLVATTRNDVDLDTQNEFPTLESRVRDAPTANGRRALDATVALLVNHSRPFGLESPVSYAPVINPNARRFLRTYRVSSLAQSADYRQLYGRAAGDRRWSPEVRAYYTAPPTDPRFRDLARRIVAERVPERLRNDPFALAMGVKLWLDHELTYSIRERHAGVPDPTADFLFGNRTGYCVHFAHSAVFLWRTLGIPSRISTGYHVDNREREGLQLTVRSKDAHAWPELYLEGYGWIVLDIAAERVIDEPPSGQGGGDERREGRIATPMAVVVLDDDYSPPGGNYYFRMRAWSRRDGAMLAPTARPELDRDVATAFPNARVALGDVPPLGPRSRVDATVALLVNHPQPFALESPASLSPLDNPSPERFVRAYRFTAHALSTDYRRLAGQRAGDPSWPADVRAYYTDAPSDPRYLALARRVVAERLPDTNRADPFAQALAVKLWMDHELTSYRAARHSDADDPTADFLFGDHAGYNVLWAHAAVYLWRSLGIPARVAAGYRYAESSRRGGSSLLLRATDEHAWPELYLAGHGWVVLDNAPERSLDAADDAVDEELQRMLGEMARRMPRDPDARERGPRATARYGRQAGLALLGLVAAAVALMYLVKLWRRVAPWVAPAGAMPRVAYRKALDVLAEAGLSRAYGESRERFAERVKGVAPSFARLTELHVGARLGGPSRAAPPRDELRALVRDVARETSKNTKRWRRALGLLHPASWLDAR